MKKMYHLDTCFVCFVTLIVLNFGSVAIFTDKPGFIYRSEGSNADITCESTDLYHQWSQSYMKGAIGHIPLQKGMKKTHYNISVEKFDDKSRIYCAKGNKQKDTSKELKSIFPGAKMIDHIIKHLFVTSIRLIETSKPIEEPKILRYSKTTNILFSCEEYVNETQNEIYLGVINTTSNIIVTHNLTTVSVHNNFNSTHNGTTILCCIYYEVSGTDDEKWINRHVAKKTMLIYDDEIWNNGLNETESSNQAIMIYVTAVVALIFILLVVIGISKKRCRKEPKSDSKVLYADLEILRTEPGPFQRPRPEDEPCYAQIIGVMRPETHSGNQK